MPVVLDCSVAMSWCFNDEADALAAMSFERVYISGAIVPALWPLEILNALTMAARRGRVSEENAQEFLALLDTLDIQVAAPPARGDWTRLLRLAQAEELTVYDVAYLDLALQAGEALASRDKALVRAARRLGVEVIFQPD